MSLIITPSSDEVREFSIQSVGDRDSVTSRMRIGTRVALWGRSQTIVSHSGIDVTVEDDERGVRTTLDYADFVMWAEVR